MRTTSIWKHYTLIWKNKFVVSSVCNTIHGQMIRTITIKATNITMDQKHHLIWVMLCQKRAPTSLQKTPNLCQSIAIIARQHGQNHFAI